MKSIHGLVQTTLGVVLLGLATVASGQAYPNKPIRFIVPYTSGGSVTFLARLVGDKLSERLGQPVVIDNRPGGNTVIGSEALVKSPPDGYTIMAIAVDHVIIPSLVTMPFDAIKDFAPVATISSGDYLLLINPSVPANNVKEFVALAKANPTKVSYGSSALGGSAHLSGELLNSVAGTKMQHIAYKGAATTDLLGGHIQAAFIAPASVMGFVESGKLRALATTGEHRSPGLPNVPTFAEAGFPGVEVKNWYGVLAPAGTPKEVIDKLSNEIAAIVALPEVKEKLANQGMRPFISTPEELGKLMRSEGEKYGKIIKAANIKIEN